VVPLLREAADLGQLSGEIYAGQWVDIGTPQKLSDINNAS
jgi:MurNAc alpha-1-phosphate uridylyltransferase